MKKKIIVSLSLVFFFILSSFVTHKFYMAIYQINYVPEKKMLQITTRIFVDDLNKALEKKYNKKFFLGSDKETSESLDYLKKYLAATFVLQVNGQTKAMNLANKEMDGDVLVCYLSIKEISKIKDFEIYNSVLLECFSEQQNIVHVSMFDTKKSILFTETSTRQVLKY